MIPAIYDLNDGIRLTLHLENGISVNFDMDDETAKEMINIIQNKLNARF